jgi:hypothetical protein
MYENKDCIAIGSTDIVVGLESSGYPGDEVRTKLHEPDSEDASRD